jgi:tRNA A-37 threonylcarbamoyl transferase component Bud32/precorrin-6B methylase 2
MADRLQTLLLDASAAPSSLDQLYTLPAADIGCCNPDAVVALFGQMLKSSLDSPGADPPQDAVQGQAALWDQPNKFARAPGIELGSTVTVHGYQEYEIQPGKVTPLREDAQLRRKRQLVAPYFAPRFLTGKTLLDIGANGGFFSIWACQAGAKRVVALDLDKAYLSLIGQVQDHLGMPQIQRVNCRVQDWQESADVVLAFAMVHWLYSCTAGYGSLEAVINKLARLSRLVLLVEWVENEDAAIRSFKHTDWNPSLLKGPYNREAFEEALCRHFHKVEIVGSTTATRVLYAASTLRSEFSCDPSLPLLAPPERILSSRCLTRLQGLDYHSRVYTADTLDRVIKQASRDMAVHEGEVLSKLSGIHFPRVLGFEQCDGYSILTLERISGSSLLDAGLEVAASPKRVAAFFAECLSMLMELRATGVEHRDIRPENFLVRNGSPVLIDFGWAQCEGHPFPTPTNLETADLVSAGPEADVRAMSRVFQQLIPRTSKLFAPLLEQMREPAGSPERLIEELRRTLDSLNLPEHWDAPLVFPAAAGRKPLRTGLEGAIPPQQKPPFFQRTWRRWRRSMQKRLGKPTKP